MTDREGGIDGRVEGKWILKTKLFSDVFLGTESGVNPLNWILSV